MTLYIEGSDGFVASSAASIATGQATLPRQDFHLLKYTSIHGARTSLIILSQLTIISDVPLSRPPFPVCPPFPSTRTQGKLPGGVWREVPLPAAPYKIEAGDLLFIDAAGTMLDHPIQGIYLVEPLGTVALGPSYGRAKVEGATLAGAQRAIEKKLREVAAKAAVSVTLAGCVGDASTLLPGTRSAAASPDVAGCRPGRRTPPGRPN